MPLTEKGHEIEANMKKEYGEKKGESVFYASKNAGTISGVDSVPIGAGYDADPERLRFASHEAKNPVEQRRKEREAAMARGENPYPAHPPESKDSVPLGSCYKDDVPPALLYGEPKISPTSTSQYSGMQEQLRTAPQPEPHEPIDAETKHDPRSGEFTAGGEGAKNIAKGLARHSEETEGSAKKFPLGTSVRANVQGSRAEKVVGHSGNMLHLAGGGMMHHTKAVSADSPLSDLDAFARLGAAPDAWTDMLGRRDFSGDINSSMGNLPAEVTHAQIKQMGAGFNYNQGYGGDPYKK
jgi:hypothetical protein